MRIVYEEQDTVEFRGMYWTVLAITGYNTVYLRNTAGVTVDDVPIDQLKPTPGCITTAVYSVERSY